MTNTLAHPDVTSDGLSLAVRVGAAIDKDVASAGFWTPGSVFKSGSARRSCRAVGWTTVVPGHRSASECQENSSSSA
ncbi:hypothetical protein ABIB75_005755 [Bradyrhizobium sp. GM2.2]